MAYPFDEVPGSAPPTSPRPTSTPRLEVQHLSKTFGSVRVLTDVTLSIQPGEIHGLAGQNGSGKSTLIKILTGVHAPDSGAQLFVDGNPLRVPVRWPEVHAAGVSVVHQDLGLLDQLSVADNICVGGFPTVRVFGRIDRGGRDRLAATTLDRLGVDIDPGRLVATLTAPERAEVAIARALRDQAGGAGMIILDESTRALTGADLARIHALLRRIAGQGGAALMISHSLPELTSVTDRITILRDGRLVGAGLLAADITDDEIARRMLGSALAVPETRAVTSTAVGATKTIAVSSMTGARVRDVEFGIAPGEILGVTGLPGNGYEEIPYLVSGVSPAKTGTLRTRNGIVDLRTAGVTTCIRAGIVLVPERRDRDGLALEQSVRDNISLPALRSRGSAWFVGRKWQRREADLAIETMGIRPPRSDLLVKQLSGGNQQKVLLFKWLALGPSLLVLHEPTQGVDVGARQDILRALRRAADGGMAVLVVSSEPEDLAGACDRVLIYEPGTGLVEVDASTSDVLIERVYQANTPLAAGG